jgi:hypothetical protein
LYGSNKDANADGKSADEGESAAVLIGSTRDNLVEAE